MPAPTSPSGPRAPGLWRRAETRLAARHARRLVAGLNVLVLLVAIAPFALWEGFGPARFDAVELGRHPDHIELETGEPIAVPDGSGADRWSAADLPFDLSPTTTVTLVFSVGSRDLDPAEAERLRVHDVADRGGDGLTDTIMLVVADRATRDVALLSLPRDLWVHERGHRINATFNLQGPQAFVDDVARASGLPIHHLVRMNFGAFARLVDAIGGVAMHVDRPLADVPAVLYVPAAGCWRFDGAGALAWSRGRHTLTRDDDGDWVTDASASDFGRIERQQALLGAIWDQVRGPDAVRSLPHLLAVARDGMVVDEGLGVQQVRDLLTVFGDLAAGNVEGHTLPTTGRRIGGAAAQVVDPAAATEVLTRLRTWPPTTGDATPRGAGTDLRVLAAPTTLALPTTAPCTLDTAQALPDPRAPLGGVAASRDGPPGTPPGAGSDPSEAPPRDTVSPGPSAEPSSPSSPGGPAATPSPTPSPSQSPSPSPSETDDGGLPVPLPGWGGSDG